MCKAIEEIKAEGEEIGFAKGEEIGIAKGEEIGFAKGAVLKAQEIARDMLNSGDFSIDVIAKFCHLTVDEVKALGNPT